MTQCRVELGDEIMNLAGILVNQPEDTTDSSVKFDTKGSLHIMCRNEDGKLLKDIPINNELKKLNNDDYNSILTEVDAIKKSNKRSRIVFNSIVAGITILLLLCLVVLSKLGG